MLFLPTKPRCKSEPDERLHGVPDVTPLLMASMMRRCQRLAPGSEQSARMRRLLAARAWTDAALALIEIEAPQWTLRRLNYDDGQWCCTLGRRRQLPEWLDDTVEASHEVLPLAIVEAVAEARRAESAAQPAGALTVPRLKPTTGDALCCDDFA